MHEILLLVGGFVARLLAERLGMRNPLPGADKPFTDCLEHLHKVQSGDVKLDDSDRAVLRSIKPVLEEVLR